MFGKSHRGECKVSAGRKDPSYKTQAHNSFKKSRGGLETEKIITGGRKAPDMYVPVKLRSQTREELQRGPASKPKRNAAFRRGEKRYVAQKGVPTKAPLTIALRSGLEEGVLISKNEK